MAKIAIINVKTKEFYADPVYTDKNKAMEKLVYLEEYRHDHNMPEMAYDLEELTPEREVQHKKEWDRFVSMID